jgi:hypothetical protein
MLEIMVFLAAVDSFKTGLLVLLLRMFKASTGPRQRLTSKDGDPAKGL